jgi:hypothetical protein
MQQHPIPQNVTTYQFRLIGEMTLKQFLELCVGVALAIFFYYTNLFSALKWLFILSSVFFGFALAFLPIEERPLDQWFFAFVRAIYSPTQYIWRKSLTPPAYLAYAATHAPVKVDDQELARQAIERKRAGLSSFLQTLPGHPSTAQLEAGESSRLHSIQSLFGTTPSPPTPNPALSGQAPIARLNIDTTPAPPPPNSAAPTHASHGSTKTYHPVTVVELKTPTIIKEEKVQTTIPQPNSQTAPEAAPQPSSNTLAVAKKLSPQSVAATSSDALPIPLTPTAPNTVVGMVIDPQEKLVENAIIEIRDSVGIPVRATKSNRLGQFFSTTPLKNGTYEIEIEKPGLTFDIIKLDLTGQIIQPLKIQAKS